MYNSIFKLFSNYRGMGNVQVETDSSRRRFRTERELERTRIEEEKKKVQVRNVIRILSGIYVVAKRFIYLSSRGRLCSRSGAASRP